MEKKTSGCLDEKNAKYVNDMVTSFRIGTKVAAFLIGVPFLLIFIVLLIGIVGSVVDP